MQLHLDDLSVVAINHHQETKDVIFIGDVYSRNMEKLWALIDRIRVGATSAVEIAKAEIPEKVKQDLYFVDLRLEDSQGNLVSENFYWMAGDDDFTSLTELPEVELDVGVKKVDIGERRVYKIRLQNSSDNLAFFVIPSIRKAKTGEEVLPCFWSDNYFSILPERHKELTVEFQKQEFWSDKLVLNLDGWNIVSRTIPID